MFRSSLPEVFYKKGVLRNLAKFTENTCARVSFLKFQASVCDIINKETLTAVFLWALQNFKEHFNLQKAPPVAASVYLHFCCLCSWLGFHGFMSIRFILKTSPFNRFQVFTQKYVKLKYPACEFRICCWFFSKILWRHLGNSFCTQIIIKVTTCWKLLRIHEGLRILFKF